MHYRVGMYLVTSTLSLFLLCISLTVTRQLVDGNNVFDSVRSIADSHSERHHAMLQKFEQCRVEKRVRKIIVAQDGTGGGGIGNLMLKIKYGFDLFPHDVLVAVLRRCLIVHSESSSFLQRWSQFRDKQRDGIPLTATRAQRTRRS